MGTLRGDKGACKCNCNVTNDDLTRGFKHKNKVYYETTDLDAEVVELV